MRWDALPLLAADPPAPPPLIERRTVARTFDGITFYEMRARSIINRIPDTPPLPYRWAVSPYRGCAHGCRYCAARGTHRYFELDPGPEFDSKVLVKTNAAARLRDELASPRWAGETIALGLTGDCYQPAEGHYALMPGILSALRKAANPFAVLTRSPLILRDLEPLAEAAAAAEVDAFVSVGFVDDQLRRSIEPGAPTPQKRLEVCATLNEGGVPCGVLMAPILPCLTDSPAQLQATVRRIAEAGAVNVVPIVLHLPAGARQWYMTWLAAEHPRLLPRYAELYGRRRSPSLDYQQRIIDTVRRLARLYGIGRATPRHGSRRHRPGQLALL